MWRCLGDILPTSAMLAQKSIDISNQCLYSLVLWDRYSIFFASPPRIVLSGFCWDLDWRANWLLCWVLLLIALGRDGQLISEGSIVARQLWNHLLWRGKDSDMQCVVANGGLATVRWVATPKWAASNAISMRPIIFPNFVSASFGAVTRGSYSFITGISRTPAGHWKPVEAETLGLHEGK